MNLGKEREPHRGHIKNPRFSIIKYVKVTYKKTGKRK